ncbi:MAG: multicomponent Na+:H+ antiporter subunit MnhG [Phormidesmis priestleyi Ana]|uniref:Multicomponent Na+:H+ antiporter subunit MnhG n=1 Tax=Phormidesmis priestleyi Ana TaxID=1666911 RepID=A0A0P8BMY5_9CYAN|nr:MAG: multicomponent Na+:H+ antiporter subunit MnhG [Phormidesmis priestleyi Ana]
MVNIISTFCIGLGVVFWLWGTLPLLDIGVAPSGENRSILFKLHSLSVSDTLGSMSIVVGLLFRLSREWPLLLLALFSLAIWNTVLSYVLAYTYCDSGTPSGRLN